MGSGPTMLKPHLFHSGFTILSRTGVFRNHNYFCSCVSGVPIAAGSEIWLQPRTTYPTQFTFCILQWGTIARDRTHEGR